MDNRSLSHTRWKCQYHIVFIPKYRKRFVAQILVDIKKEQNELKDILGSEYQDYNLVMATTFGLPISAITARAEVMDAAPAGTIGGTFCGNPVSCAAALAVMDIMKRDDYAGKARHIGEVVMKRYKELQEKYPVIGDVRGLGAMIGIELVKDKETKEPATELTAKLIQNAIQKGLLLENCGTAGNVVRFLAPLTMTDEQMEKGLEIFEASLKEAMEA